MSSNAASLSPETAKLRAAYILAASAFLVGVSPLAAQNDQPVTQDAEQDEATTNPEPPAANPRPRRRETINLSITVPREESDELLAQDCEEEADAAQIAGEIIVCRQLGEASDGSWNKEDWERRYAERTKGGNQADVAGGGIFRGEPTVGGLCVIPPCPGEPALMIDVEALPSAPPGSDADRIARGLPPLGRDPQLSPEEIARRRRALGLEAPPIPEE